MVFCLQRAHRNIFEGSKLLTKVVFADEKKVHPRWPRCLSMVWARFTKRRRAFSDTTKWGCSVMIWAALCSYRLSKITLKTGNQKATFYINMLGSFLLPFVAETFGESTLCLFHQDNLPIHTAIKTCRWLKEKQIHKLPWPSKCPDLNIIENVCVFMGRHVYKRRNQYSSVSDLKEGIMDARVKPSMQYIFRLYNSMPRRLMAVMDDNCKATKY